MRHGTPCPGSDPPQDDLELGLVTADLTALAILDRLCECDGVCTCQE